MFGKTQIRSPKIKETEHWVPLIRNLLKEHFREIN